MCRVVYWWPSMSWLSRFSPRRIRYHLTYARYDRLRYSTCHHELFTHARILFHFSQRGFAINSTPQIGDLRCLDLHDFSPGRNTARAARARYDRLRYKNVDQYFHAHKECSILIRGVLQNSPHKNCGHDLQRSRELGNTSKHASFLIYTDYQNTHDLIHRWPVYPMSSKF